MKKRNAVYCVTARHPKKIVRSVILTVLANFGNLIPVGFLTLAVLSLYSYFGGASEVLDLHQLWMVWGTMGIAAVVLYFLELAANHATYYGGYAAGAQGRVGLAEHIRKLPLGYLMSKDPGELGNTMMNDFSLIEDDIKMFYYRGLKEWQNERGYLRDTCLSAQDRFQKYLDYFRVPYDK